MLKIKLKRIGKKHHPLYRIVVGEDRSKRDGKCLAELGTYNPMNDPCEIKINKEEAEKWIKNGAKPTNTVRSLLQKTGFFYNKCLDKCVSMNKITESEKQKKMDEWKKNNSKKVKIL